MTNIKLKKYTNNFHHNQLSTQQSSIWGQAPIDKQFRMNGARSHSENEIKHEQNIWHTYSSYPSVMFHINPPS